MQLGCFDFLNERQTLTVHSKMIVNQGYSRCNAQEYKNVYLLLHFIVKWPILCTMTPAIEVQTVECV